jgi:hypothetical protein
LALRSNPTVTGYATPQGPGGGMATLEQL